MQCSINVNFDPSRLRAALLVELARGSGYPARAASRRTGLTPMAGSRPALQHQGHDRGVRGSFGRRATRSEKKGRGDPRISDVHLKEARSFEFTGGGRCRRRKRGCLRRGAELDAIALSPQALEDLAPLVCSAETPTAASVTRPVEQKSSSAGGLNQLERLALRRLPERRRIHTVGESGRRRAVRKRMSGVTVQRPRKTSTRLRLRRSRRRGGVLGPVRSPAEKDGHPVPDSNFVPDSNGGLPQPARSVYVPGSMVAAKQPTRARSVPCSQRTRYSSGVSRRAPAPFAFAQTQFIVHFRQHSPRYTGPQRGLPVVGAARHGCGMESADGGRVTRGYRGAEPRGHRRGGLPRRAARASPGSRPTRSAVRSGRLRVGEIGVRGVRGEETRRNVRPRGRQAFLDGARTCSPGARWPSTRRSRPRSTQ